MNELRSWIGDVAGGVVASMHQLSGGASRETWLVVVSLPDGEREFVLRRDTGTGPLSETELTLRREAAVYRALAGTGIPAPALHGETQTGDALLLDLVPGSDDFASLADPAEREAVVGHYFEILGRLHALDPAQLDLPGFERPVTPKDHALLDLAMWERMFTTRAGTVEPLLRFAFGWLRRNPPNLVERTCLVHGDAGPGNFLFHAGAVTGLLDWEFAHVGDPMDDLAWVLVRSHLLQAPLGAMTVNLKRYTEASGLGVDRERVAYYRALVLVRMIVSCLMAVRAGRRSPVYHVLPPLLRSHLCRTLAEIAQIPLERIDPPPAGEDTPRTPIIETLVNELAGVVLPATAGAIPPRDVMALAALAMHLHAADRLAPAIEEIEIEEAAALTGRRPTSLREGTAGVDRVVAEAGPERDADLLCHLWRRSQREMTMWATALGGFAEMPLPDLQG